MPVKPGQNWTPLCYYTQLFLDPSTPWRLPWDATPAQLKSQVMTCATRGLFSDRTLWPEPRVTDQNLPTGSVSRGPAVGETDPILDWKARTSVSKTRFDSRSVSPM